MIGTKNGGGTMTLPNAASSNTSATASSQRSLAAGVTAPKGIIATVLVIVGLTVVFAILGQREKIRGALEPHSIVINAWNMLIVAVIVLADFLLLKILLAKMVAWHFPGASTIASVVHAAA